MYKIHLTLRDLLILKPEQIKEIARNPQPLVYSDESGLAPLIKNINPSKKAEILYREAVEKCKTTRTKLSIIITDKKTLENLDIQKVFCRAELFIVNNNIAFGLRNNSTIRLLSKLRIKGFSQEAAEYFIMKWNQKNLIGLAENELLSVIRSVYSKDYTYDYGCNDEIISKFCPYKDRSDCEDYKVYIEKKYKKESSEGQKNEKAIEHK